MITALAFIAAAAAGALARAGAGHRWNRNGGLAAGTLVVNVTGSFLLGLLSAHSGPEFTVLGIGALGAFTTYSSFARDIVAAIEIRQLALAGTYTAATLIGGTLSAAAGVALA